MLLRRSLSSLLESKLVAHIAATMHTSLAAIVFLLAGSGAFAEYSADNVTFQLYTRNSNMPRELDNAMSGLDVRKPTILIIHGFGGSSKAKSSHIVKDAVLSELDWNAVLVDWGLLAKSDEGYDAAVKNTLPAGRAVARLAKALLQSSGAQGRNLTVVGFSLGAHVAGVAAQHMGTEKLPRIIGLDAAGPMYDANETKNRLDSGDADFVMAIHTSSNFFGASFPIGHVDFYPNGGRSPQPPCAQGESKQVCSHFLAPLLFAESIYNPTAFPAIKCANWSDYTNTKCQQQDTIYMGLDTPSTARGQYFLQTSASAPYGNTSGSRVPLLSPHDLEMNDEPLVDDLYDAENEDLASGRQRVAEETSHGNTGTTSSVAAALILSLAAVALCC